MAQGGLTNAAVAVLAMIGACTSSSAKPTPSSPSAEASSPADTSPLASATPAPPAPSEALVQDACGAGPLQYLVGRPHTDIPAPLTPDRRRVVCSTCVLTHDYAPHRQTITYDSATGVVTSVRCG